MPRLMIMCPNKKKPVPTGIASTKESLDVIVLLSPLAVEGEISDRF